MINTECFMCSNKMFVQVGEYWEYESNFWEDGKFVSKKVLTKYCPMCGKKLEESE